MESILGMNSSCLAKSKVARGPRGFGRAARAHTLKVCALLTLAISCSDDPPQPEAQRTALRELVSVEALQPTHKLDVRFGDAVRLLGYDLSPEPVRNGQQATITWYWQVEKPLPKGYRQFTHLAPSSGGKQLNLDQARTLAKLYPPDRWEAGRYLKDPQNFTVPSAWRTQQVEFILGFYRGEKRLEAQQPGKETSHRAQLLLPVLAKRPGPPVARMKVRKRTAPIMIDGKLDEADWKAAHVATLVNTFRGDQGSFPAQVQVVYDEANLFVGFEVEDSDLRASFLKHDEHLWEQDTVEVMLDPDGDGRNYFEIQVSPRNVVFDTQYDRRRIPRPFGHVDWDANVESAVEVVGTIDAWQTADERYVVEMRLPVSALKANGVHAAAPAPGGEYRANFFVMERQLRGQRAVGWSPPMVGDFHAVDRFGVLQFD